MKKLSVVMALIVVVSTLLAVSSFAAKTPETLQPKAGDRTLQTIGKANAWAQQPKITDNGDGTYSVKIGNGEWNTSWTENISDSQWTNSNGGEVTWNIYFPRVYYEAGLVKPATEVCWGLHNPKDLFGADAGESDLSDLNDIELYYSDDSVTWKKAQFQLYTYDPFAVRTDGQNEFGDSAGCKIGVRFVFKEPISAKYFFVND
ncbi:MAG: hypothetical protein J6Z80_01880, partial [Clostridia bacterium]|nr:hypothetical protein [Clostridia bacterium]